MKRKNEEPLHPYQHMQQVIENALQGKEIEKLLAYYESDSEAFFVVFNVLGNNEKRQLLKIVSPHMQVIENALQGKEIEKLWVYYTLDSKAFLVAFNVLENNEKKQLLNIVSSEKHQPFFWEMIDYSIAALSEESGDEASQNLEISIQQLIAWGANLTYRDPIGDNLLHFLVENDHTDALSNLCDLASPELERIELLVHDTNQEGNTPLHLTLEKDRGLELADKLMILGAFSTAKNHQTGETPLHLVYQVRKRDHQAWLDLFKDALECQDFNGDTPFSAALMAGYFIKELATKTTLYQKNVDALTPFFLFCTLGESMENPERFEAAFQFFTAGHFVNKDKLLSQIDGQGNTLLLYCIRFGCIQVFKKLYALGIFNLTDQNFDGFNGLANAILSNNLEMVKCIWAQMDWMAELQSKPNCFQLPTGASIFSLVTNSEVDAFLKKAMGGDLEEKKKNSLFEISKTEDCYGISTQQWQRVFSKRDGPEDKEIRSFIQKSIQSNLGKFPEQNVVPLIKELFEVKNDPIYDTLLQTFQHVFLLNPHHIQYFSFFFQEGLEHFCLQAKTTPLFLRFLKKNLELLQGSKEPLNTCISPWIANLYMMDSSLVSGVFCQDNSSWLAFQKNSVKTLSVLFHEWVHRIVALNKLDLSSLSPFWEKIHFRMENGFVRPPHVPGPFCSYLEKLMLGILDEDPEDYCEELFARFIEGLYIDKLALDWFEAQLVGQDFFLCMSDLLSVQDKKQENMTLFNQKVPEVLATNPNTFTL